MSMPTAYTIVRKKPSDGRIAASFLSTRVRKRLHGWKATRFCGEAENRFFGSKNLRMHEKPSFHDFNWRAAVRTL